MATLRLIRRPEFVDSSGNPPTRTYRYLVVGTTVTTIARNYVAADAPIVIATPQGILYRQDITTKQTAYDRFECEATYATRNREPGQWSWDGDTTGETVQVTISKESIRRYGVGVSSEAGSASASNIPKHNGAIGVEADGTITGTSQVIPALRFNVQYKYPPGVVTPAHLKYIYNLTGKVNSANFLAWSAGEVLFLGGRLTAGDQVESTAHFSFAMSPNATGLSFGSITGVDKKGWEYCWLSYAFSTSATRLSRNPEFAYVERIYDTTDLAAALGIY